MRYSGSILVTFKGTQQFIFNFGNRNATYWIVPRVLAFQYLGHKVKYLLACLGNGIRLTCLYTATYIDMEPEPKCALPGKRTQELGEGEVLLLRKSLNLGE